jgi:hypothetical protein
MTLEEYRALGAQGGVEVKGTFPAKWEALLAAVDRCGPGELVRAQVPSQPVAEWLWGLLTPAQRRHVELHWALPASPAAPDCQARALMQASGRGRTAHARPEGCRRPPDPPSATSR